MPYHYNQCLHFHTEQKKGHQQVGTRTTIIKSETKQNIIDPTEKRTADTHTHTLVEENQKPDWTPDPKTKITRRRDYCNNAQVIRIPFWKILCTKLGKKEQSKGARPESKTNFIKLDVTETKSLKLGNPQREVPLTYPLSPLKMQC